MRNDTIERLLAECDRPLTNDWTTVKRSELKELLVEVREARKFPGHVIASDPGARWIMDQRREYVAANLRAALALVPDTGDWHGELRGWCDAHKGDREPNAPIPEQIERLRGCWSGLDAATKDRLRREARAQAFEECEKIAKTALLPDHFQWGHDAMEQFDFTKEHVADAIRARAKETP